MKALMMTALLACAGLTACASTQHPTCSHCGSQGQAAQAPCNGCGCGCGGDKAKCTCGQKDGCKCTGDCKCGASGTGCDCKK